LLVSGVIAPGNNDHGIIDSCVLACHLEDFEGTGETICQIVKSIVGRGAPELFKGFTESRDRQWAFITRHSR
jgi:hypothetical protein